MCYDAGFWQAFLDGEVSGAVKSAMEEHLRLCKACRGTLQREMENLTFTNTKLSAYLYSPERSDVDAGAAWGRFENCSIKKSEISARKGVLKMLTRYRAAATAAAVLLALAVSLSFAPVRGAASELLTIFRIEKVKTVDISPSDIASIEKAIREGSGQVDIENFGKVEFLGSQASSRASLEEARAAVDFQLNLPAVLPGGFNTPEIYKHSGGTLNFTLDTVNANQILKALGSDKLLPAELNGKTFTVRIPAQITANYRSQDSNRVFIGIGRSPELVAPGSDVLQIRDALLALPFLPDSLRSQLASINDWQHTFVVPNIGGSSQEVVVAGAQGVFIKSPPSEASGSETASLVWQKDGVVYTVSGSLTLQQALDIAGLIQ
mgnify:CR=1 FL=1